MSSKFIEEYKQKKEFLKKRFEVEKTEDQTLFIDRETLFKPLIKSQKECSKALEDKLVASQDILSNTLVPLTREFQKRNDQLDTLKDLPFYYSPAGIEDVPQSTPQKDRDVIDVNLDAGLLNDTHRENLQDMGFDLPSEVQKKGMIEETLDKITSKSKSIGQKLREDRGTKPTAKDKEIYQSQKQTLKIYKASILDLQGVEKFI